MSALISAVAGQRPLTRHERLATSTRKRTVSTVSDTAAATAIAIQNVCKYVLEQAALCGSRNKAIRLMLLQHQLGELPWHVSKALASASVGQRGMPQRSAICRWCQKYEQGGVDGVIKNHKGNSRKDGGWEAKAVEIYSQPTKPSMAAVHRDLCRIWAFDCTYEQVRSYLSALPAQLGKNSAARLGSHLYKQQQKAFVLRHTRNLKAGSIYMADGYRADVYLAHPVTGGLWRPEIMHVIDLKSRYLVGYRIMANEGGYDVMVGWAEIFERWNHVPPLLYVDNGSGYKNKLTELEDTSYYQRAGVQAVIHSIPHNPKGKGHIERYHRIVRDDFLKTWQPAFYCGPDMAKEVLDKTARDIDSGKIAPPSLAQFIEAYNDWIANDYHRRPHPENKYVTRSQEWSALDPIAPHATAAEMARPMERRKVQRASVQLHSRRYQHPELHAWNGEEVRVEFDILNHHSVTIRAANGLLICDAPLVEAIGVVGDSFLADKEQKALEAKSARIEKKAIEARARAGLLIDADAVADGALLEGTATRLLGNDEDEIKLFDF